MHTLDIFFFNVGRFKDVDVKEKILGFALRLP